MNSHEHRSLLPPALGPDGDHLLDHLPGDAQFPREVGLRESLGEQRLHNPAPLPRQFHRPRFCAEIHKPLPRKRAHPGGFKSGMRRDVAHHGVRVAAFGVEVGIGVVFRDAPGRASCPTRRTTAGGPRASRRRARRRRAEGGRPLCNSPAQCGPGDAPAGVPVDAPFPRAGDRSHDIQAVGATVVAQSVAPRASGVLHLDPEASGRISARRGECVAIAGATVQDGVSGELRCDQDRLVGLRAASLGAIRMAGSVCQCPFGITRFFSPNGPWFGPFGIRSAHRAVFSRPDQRIRGRSAGRSRRARHVASMDNAKVFGLVLHRLTFGEVIERDLLSDCQVIVVGVDDEMY